jgi:transcriptional regulator with XRE-family HTH domain
MNTRILEVRKNAGLTQQAFADKIGVKRNTVAVYEAGGCNVSDSVIKNICNEFSVREQWLRTGEGDMYIPVEDETAAVVASLLDESSPTYDLILKFARDYQRLDDKSRKVIDDFIDGLLDKKEKAD